MNIAARFGLTVAAAVGFFFLATTMFARYPEIKQHRFIVAGALAGLGVITSLAGRARSATAESDAPLPALGQKALRPRERFSLVSPNLWGPILIICGGMTLGLNQIRSGAEATQARFQEAAQARESDGTGRDSEGPGKKKARKRGNTLKLQGIFYRKTRPGVLINGEVLNVGGRIGSATVREIGRESVVLDIDGQKHTLRLGE